MATFPKLLSFQNPWKKTLSFFMSGESPKSGSESLPNWKGALMLRAEQADLTRDQETELRAKIKEWKPNKNEGQDLFEAKIRYEIARKAVINRTGNQLGELTNETITGKDALVFLEANDGKALSKMTAPRDLTPGAELTVDYGIGNPAINQSRAHQAERRLGLQHMFANAPQVTKIQVTQSAERGGATVTLIRCADGKYRQEGHLKEKRHFPVYQDYKVKVLEIGGKTEAQQVETELEAVKREDADLKAAGTKLQEAQKAEAASTSEVTAEAMAQDRRSALEMAGVYAPAEKPSSVEATTLTPEAEAAFDAETAKLKTGTEALIKEVFKREGKESEMVTACKSALDNKKFVSITFKSLENTSGDEGATTQGQLQEITLTVVDKKGINHVYKGVSDQPIGTNLVEKKLPSLVAGAETVKDNYWNNEAFRALFKEMAKNTGGVIPHPTMDSPYANGVIYGAVRAAGTNGEEDSSETYVPSDKETASSRLTPNSDVQGHVVEDSNRDGFVDGSDKPYVDQVQSLKFGEGARLPAAMKDWTVRDFEANKHRIDYMDQFWDSLQVLSKQCGRPEMELLKPFLDGDKITYQELCRQVLGRTPQRVWDEYAEARAGVAEQKDYAALHPGEPAPTDNAPSKVVKTDKALGKDEYYTYGELKALVKNRDDFFVASYRLLESTRLLEKNTVSMAMVLEAGKDASQDTVDEVSAKNAIAILFNPDDTAPVAKRTFAELFQDKSEFEASMDQMQRSYHLQGENVYEGSISSSGAYAQLVGEFIRNGEVDYVKLTARLNQMKKAGFLFFDRMNEKDRSKLEKQYAEKLGCDKTEVRAKLEAASKVDLTEAQLKTPNPFNAQEILLIQMGMIPETKRTEASNEATVDRAREREIATTAEKVESATQAQVEAALKEAGLTADEIKVAETAILSRMRVSMNERGQFGLALNQIGGRGGNDDAAIGYGNTVVDIPLGEKGHLAVSVGVGAAFIENIHLTFYPTVGAAVSVSRKFGGQDQNTASINAGVSVGPGHIGGGVMASLKFKAQEKAEGTISERARVWYFKVGAGIAGGVGAGEGLASVRFLEFEIGRDLDAAAHKKYLKLKERMGDRFDAELNGYVKANLELYQADIKQATEGMTETEVKAYIKALEVSIANVYILERGADAINEMCAIQFSKVGVGIGFGALGGVVPYFGIAIKGRKVVNYVKTGPDMDVVLEAKVREQLASENPGAVLGEPVYLGGDLAMNENGERTVENSIMKFEQQRNLEAININLKKQGMELVPLAGDTKKLQLKVRDVDGFVNIYIDPTSKIQAFLSGDKAPCINLDWEDAFSILRVDNYTPFKEGGGGVKNVDVYISDNPQKTPAGIKNRTGDRLTWRQTDIYPTGSKKNLMESAAHVARNTFTEETATYKNAAELQARNADGLGDLNDADAAKARAALQADIDAFLGQEPAPEGQEARLAALDHMVTELIKKGSISYAKLTIDAAYTKSILDAVNARFTPKLSSSERTYLLQNLLVESRAKTPGSPEALKKHILGWNTRALAAFCKDQAVSDNIMGYYATTLDNLGGADLASTNLEQGYAFSTLIGQGELGTLGRGINSKWETKLAGMQEVTEANLTTTFKLSPAQAKAFMDAQLREYRYFGETTPNPMQKLRSPLGMKLLQQASAIFGMAKSTELNAAIKSGSIDTTKDYWKDFDKALQTLEKGEAYISENGYTVIPHQHMVMGFLESCRNFTVATNENLETRDNNRVAGTETHQTVNGVQGVGFTDASAAVIPEEKKSPETGSKAPGSGGQAGQPDKPEQVRPETPEEDPGVAPPA